MSSFYCQILFITVLSTVLCTSDAYYYCDKQKDICGPNEHFMCNFETVPRGGDLMHLAPMTNKLKRLVVDNHNKYRNILASGEQVFGKEDKKFPKATRMREVLWDDELAYIAEKHAARCHMMHDKCHSTERFPFSGQNLYIIGGTKMFTDIDFRIVQSIDLWWAECELVGDGISLVEKFPGSEDFHATGHFTAMANERAAFVGCGAALCQNCTSGKYCLEISCNYSLTNMHGTYMYKAGDSSASECDYFETTPSVKYPHLCINTGNLFTLEKFH
uniref:Venom allergen 5 n=1 Tax=Ceratitis capitata TaxID=7213 RepID=W8APR1_CERCA